jgi:signal transduction histidine kinase
MAGVRPRPSWRRPAERDFRRFFEALPGAVLAARADSPRFTIAAASDAYLDLTRAERYGPSGIIGCPLFEVFPPSPKRNPGGARNIRSSLERVIATRTSDTLPAQRYDLRGIDGAWEERHWSLVTAPVLDEYGRADFLIHEVVDVTDAARLSRRAADAERATTAAQEANAIKARFLAAMSHELRTPLNAIGGYVELIEMGVHGPVSDPQREALDRIRLSEQHLLGLINEVLSYAKIESGRIELERRSLGLAALIDAVVSLIAPQASQKEIRLDVGPTAADGCELEVVADPEKARQILLNLLSNAVKFTSPGGHVHVGCDADDAFVYVTVSDSGIGIAADDLGRIFEPFVQLADGKASGEGTGLGLSISRDLARAMGGDVTVKSVPGDGSSFRLRLPRAAARRRERRSA